MKKLLFVIAIVAIGFMSCGKGKADKDRLDSLMAADSITYASLDSIKDSTAVRGDSAIVCDSTIEAGVYKVKKIVDGGKMLRLKPEAKAELLSEFSSDSKAFVSHEGDFLEATGRVKNGYAEVKDHLYGDMTDSGWETTKAWIPVDCLQRVKECKHTHHII